MQIRVGVKGLEKFENLVSYDVWYKAQKRTTTEMGRKFRTKVVKDIRKTYNIKAKDLKKNMRTKLEKKGDAFVWKLNVKGKLLSLSHFGARQNKKGVSVLIRKDEGRKVLARTFIAKGQVFQREGKERLPLVRKKSLSVPQMFNKETMKEAFAEVSEGYSKRFEHNLNYYLDIIK
jgi:hypothetical protein